MKIYLFLINNYDLPLIQVYCRNYFEAMDCLLLMGHKEGEIEFIEYQSATHPYSYDELTNEISLTN